MALLPLGHEVVDPVAEIERLQNEINNLFDYDRGSLVHGLFDRAVSPAVDVVETADEFIVYCDLPGVTLSDLDISLAGGVLTIKGEKKSPFAGRDMKLYKEEIWEGHFQRTLSMPTSIDTGRIEARLESGILTITMPKKEEMKPRQIQVKVS